jgi:hypothetical protein
MPATMGGRLTEESGQPLHRSSEPATAHYGLHDRLAAALGSCLAGLRQGQREAQHDDDDNYNPEKRTKHKKTS